MAVISSSLCALPPTTTISSSACRRRPSRTPLSLLSGVSPLISSSIASAATALKASSSQQAADGTECLMDFKVEGESDVDPASSLAVGSDADKLPIASSVEEPMRTLQSSSTKVPSMSQQKIVIKNTHNENLVGVLHEAGSRELVILCHGFRSSKESKTIMKLADALTSQDICVFRFDFAGNGESEGSFQYGNYWREVEDLRTVIEHFSVQKREVRAIAGHSKGGNVVLLYASMFHDISIVVNISGRYDLKRGIEDRLGTNFMERISDNGFIDVRDNMGKLMYHVTKESLMDRLNTDMHAACLSISQNCRVLTVHGSADDIVPHEDALEFDKVIKNHKLKIVEGADHRYTSHYLHLATTFLEFI